VDLSFFRLSTAAVLLLLVLLVGGAAAVGTVVGRSLRAAMDEPPAADGP
jgi:hypothetical protein